MALEHRLAAHVHGDIVDGPGEHGVSAPGPASHVRGGGVVVAGGGARLLPPRRRVLPGRLSHAQEGFIREDVISLAQVI